METTLKPVGTRVLIRPEPVETTYGSLVIAYTSEGERRELASKQIGEVVAVGPYAWHEWEDPWAKPGDRVMYVRYGGALIQDPVTNETFILLVDADILCKIESPTSEEEETQNV